MAFLLALCLAGLSVGAASTVPLVRQEKIRAHLGALGNVLFEKDLSTGEEPPCNEDYVMGTPLKSTCVDTGDSLHQHVLVTSRAKCLTAALNHGVHVMPIQQFVISDSVVREKNPEGCFKAPCKKHGGVGAPDGDCYFYNPIGYEPDTDVEGTPVCARPKHLLGTPNTNTCPDHYELIMDNTECQESALCLTYGEGGQGWQANEKNNSKFDDFPKGCFIREKDLAGDVDGKVYMNNPITDWPHDLPTGPRGTAICIATNRIAKDGATHTEAEEEAIKARADAATTEEADAKAAGGDAKTAAVAAATTAGGDHDAVTDTKTTLLKDTTAATST